MLVALRPMHVDLTHGETAVDSEGECFVLSYLPAMLDLFARENAPADLYHCRGGGAGFMRGGRPMDGRVPPGVPGGPAMMGPPPRGGVENQAVDRYCFSVSQCVCMLRVSQPVIGRAE